MPSNGTKAMKCDLARRRSRARSLAGGSGASEAPETLCLRLVAAPLAREHRRPRQTLWAPPRQAQLTCDGGIGNCVLQAMVHKLPMPLHCHKKRFGGGGAGGSLRHILWPFTSLILEDG